MPFASWRKCGLIISPIVVRCCLENICYTRLQQCCRFDNAKETAQASDQRLAVAPLRWNCGSGSLCWDAILISSIGRGKDEDIDRGSSVAGGSRRGAGADV